MGWFFGPKLHLVVNDWGEIMNFQLRTGKVDDPMAVIDLPKNLAGKVLGIEDILKKIDVKSS